MTLIIRVAVVLLILSWSLQASAQADPNYKQRMLYTSKFYKFKKMKTTGLIMTAGGLILGIVGINKLNNAPYIVNQYGQITYTSNEASTGALMFIAAFPLVGAGVPLSIVGNVKQKKYGRLMESTLISGSFTPQYSGVTLRYKF